MRPSSGVFLCHNVGMTFDDYQAKAATTSTIDDLATLTLYTTLGLNGEAGEVAEKIKKIVRDKGSDFTQLDRDDITKELGDVLWYLAMLARSLDISLSSVANTNIAKLASRKSRGVLGGSGDNR